MPSVAPAAADKSSPVPPPAAHPAAERSYPEILEEKASASLRLSSLKKSSHATLKAALQHLSPDAESDSDREHAWATVLSWIVLDSLPWPDDSAASASLFDKLQLRSALAETFLSLGIGNEIAWRKAAQIRFLVLHGGASSLAAMRSHTLWNDPDVRWLAGVHEYLGQTYVNKEQFEELTAWLQLPSLVETAQQSLDTLELRKTETVLTEICEAIQKAGYNLQTYLSPPRTEEDKKQTLKQTL
jgi:hypothetical protein